MHQGLLTKSPHSGMDKTSPIPGAADYVCERPCLNPGLLVEGSPLNAVLM